MKRIKFDICNSLEIVLGRVGMNSISSTVEKFLRRPYSVRLLHLKFHRDSDLPQQLPALKETIKRRIKDEKIRNRFL